jgi:hypothetical protein
MEYEATDCFNMAHHFLVELKAAANISSLNTVIYLLECAASCGHLGDTEFLECLNHLATASLVRFIYTRDAMDVHKACILRGGALGHPVQDYLQSIVWHHIHYVC